MTEQTNQTPAQPINTKAPTPPPVPQTPDLAPQAGLGTGAFNVNNQNQNKTNYLLITALIILLVAIAVIIGFTII